MKAHSSALGASLFLLATASACGASDGATPPKSLETTCADALAQIRMPFEVELPAESGVNRIRVQTESGGYRELTFGPFGAHASPHTGHPEGNAKADMLLPYTADYAELTYLPDPNQACTAENFVDNGEVRCGLPEAEILADRFGYVVPSEGYEVVAAFKEFELTAESSNYAFDGAQWKVVIRKAVGECNLAYSFGHVASLGPSLVAALEERGIDWENAAIGENVSDHEDPIPIAAGEIVAFPQIVGDPSDLATGYVVPDPDAATIWTQIEFSVLVEYRDEQHEWQGYNVPVYRGLSPEEYATWSEVFVETVEDPENPRYGTYGAQARKWLWAAEGELMLSPGFEANDARSLPSALGGWWEGSADCGSDPTLCDEMITFFPIYRDTALFAEVESSFDPDTRYAIGKVWGFDQSRIFGEVVEILDYADGAYAQTTSLEETLRGALVLRLRSELAPEGTPLEDQILGYQTVGYDLDPVEGRLVLSWGAVRDTEELAAADVPAAPPTQADPCTGESHVAGSTTCHHKRWKEGFISAANVYP